MPIIKLVVRTCLMFVPLLLAGCGSGGSGTGTCKTGDLHCACFGNNTCNATLACMSQICVDPNDVPGAGGSTGITTGAGGAIASSACLTGDLRCACFANNTCNANLTCVSQVCIEIPSTGGAKTGGAVVAGGITASMGGAGGSSACANGNVRCPCYANNTCNANLSCISQICVEMPPPGGSTGSGAGAVVAGGAISTGGVVVTGGTSTPSSTAATTQVCADATHCTLGMDGSAVPASGNSYGIDGTFYVVGDPCTSASIKWDAANRCASGTLCAKDPPYYENWGVEISLNLNCGNGYDYGYDSTTNGVTGFFWEVTGSAPHMQVWLALAANVGACLQTTNACALDEPPWGNPSPSMGPTGNNYVSIQTVNMSYDDWGLGYTYPPPFDPTRLHSVQWKLPAQTLSTPFNFCIQKVGVLHK